MALQYKKYLFIGFVLFFSSFSLSLRVKSIQIVGNRLIQTEAIQGQLKTKKGQVFVKKHITQDVKNLFQMGYFDQISVESKKSQQEVVLIYRVKEKSKIGSIQYKGNKALSDKKLKELLEVKKYEFLNIEKLKNSIQKIKKKYEEEGYFLVNISYQIKPVQSQEKIKLILHIKEGKKALVKRIHLIGNHHISSKKIKSFMVTKEENLLSFFNSSSVYTKEKLLRDQSVIRYLYLENGYVEVSVSEPHITLSPDKKDVHISFLIDEGDSFKVGQIDFMGDLLIPKVELRQSLSLKEGEVFSYSKMQRDLHSIQTQYGDKGYAFVHVTPQPASSDKTIHILFHIKKGNLAFIHQIHIHGNDITQDKVIRRMFDLSEGDLYHASKIEQSREKIQRLGYFDSVEIAQKPLKKHPTKIDLEVQVKEREGYGVLQLGGGYSSYYGLMIQGKVHKQNLFGSGKTAGVDLSFSPCQRNIFFNTEYIDPYLLDSDWYLGGNLFIQWSDISLWDWVNQACGNAPQRSINDLNMSNQFYYQFNREFVQNRLGGRLTLGRWMLDQKIKLLSHVGMEKVKIDGVTDDRIFNVKDVDGVRLSFGTAVDYDSRSDRLFPKNGIFSNGSFVYTYQIGDSSGNHRQYLKLDTMFSYYINTQVIDFILPYWLSQQEWLKHIVLKNKIQYGYLHSLTKGKAIPFDQLYLLGGNVSLRGFPLYSVGTKKLTTAVTGQTRYVPYGGVQQLFYNLELQIPILPQARLYGSLFFDIGYAADQITLSDLRKNIGFGILFVSPMGPINLKWGFPFKPKKEYQEDKMTFQFNIGYDF